MFQQIIVPLDSSEESAQALGPASAMARRIGAPLHVVAFHIAGHDTTDLESAILAQTADTGDVVRVVELLPLEADVATDLTRLALRWGPALIVMASHGRGRSAGLLGSVAVEVLSVSDQPVLIVGPSAIRGRFRTHGPAIVAIDGQGDDDVLALTASLLAETEVEPVIVNVVEPDEAAAFMLARSKHGDDLPTDGAPARRAAERLEASTDRTDIEYDVHHDRAPADAIVGQAIAKRAAVVVMASHARTGLERLRLGSVTANVIRHSPCPVLVTRHG